MIKDVLHGLGIGFGAELSVLVLWLIWKFAHGRIGHKFHADHLFHKIGEYFD